MKPIGIMIHSTGANNPKLSRYVQPDDGVLGPNKYNNHWNQAKPEGKSVCVHGFIGKDKNGKVRFYQTLPFNCIGWHSGSGKNGSANTLGYIGIEICEDSLSDKKYFNGCYWQVLELCAYLCNTYKIPINKIIGHYEGYRQGIASNHADPNHWFKRHGKSMNTFRNDVDKRLNTNKKLYRVQVGAFHSESNAIAFRDKLIKQGYDDAFIREV